MDLQRKQIGELTTGVQQRAVYRRDNGKAYCLISPRWQMGVDLLTEAERERFSNKVTMEAVDPIEEVGVICDGVGPVAPKLWFD